MLRDIIIPQAVRKILPPLAGQFITLIKDSAIISLISIQELTFMATEVAATTTKVFETWILVDSCTLCFATVLRCFSLISKDVPNAASADGYIMGRFPNELKTITHLPS